MNKRWNLLYQDIDPEKVRKIEKAANVSPLLALLMAVRGIDSEEAADFLGGGLSTLHDPFLMRDMERAVLRIRKAISSHERITVYGDYDVDGISSTAMLLSYLQSCHACCDFYIPDRQREGYGLNADAVRQIASSGTTLIITVDTGITACEEVRLAKKLGMEVIITDHHSVPEILPEAVAVVNPHRADCAYPYKALAGGGVAFKLICALCGNTRDAVLRYADIAALATIADVVSLTGENRVIASLGLRKMRKMPSAGIAALTTVSGISSETLSAYQIGFSVAPRLNAAGRMGDCRPAVRLLLTEDARTCAQIAAELDAQNADRKSIGDAIFREGVSGMEEGGFENKKVIVLHRKDWHHGIIGIIASKITELYYKSTILIATDGVTGKGSGRAIPGLNLYDALSACADTLSRFGGHALAAGLTLPEENIAAFDAAINRYADEVLAEEDMTPVLSVDAPLPFTHSLLDTIEEISRLEPFGPGNARPVFLIERASLAGVRTSKDGKHLFLKLWKDGVSVDAVAFGKGALCESMQRGDIADIVGELQINTFGGGRSPQIIIQDIHIR